MAEALEHDQARKKAENELSHEDIPEAIQQIDSRLVMASKSLGCVLLGRALEILQNDVPDTSKLKIVEKLISLAGHCDTLGDKALLR